MEKDLSLYVAEDKPGRLDTYVAKKAKISRALTQKLISDGMVILNDTTTRRSSVLKEGDIIHLRIPMPKETKVEKQDIPLNIVYEDDDILVVNKDRGMVVHPAVGHWDGTLVNALLYHSDGLSSVGGEERPGVVHRLDKDTSGLLVVAKNDKAHQKLTQMFQTRKISKEYLALVQGKMRGHQGVINLPIGRHPSERTLMAVVPGGKTSVTKWKVRKAYGPYSLVSLFPETGRTHQIRVHLSHVGAPVVGDPEYNKNECPFGIKGQALHARRLTFEHPITGEKMEFEVPPPDDMQEIIDRLDDEYKM